MEKEINGFTNSVTNKKEWERTTWNCCNQVNNNNNNNNNNNTYIALIRMRSKRFTSIVLQYDLEI